MATKRQYFGTDGIRGRVGAYPITPDFMLKLGWAVGKVLANGGNNKVVIGKDTRISGYMFESALEAGLSAAGVNIELLGPMPTPAIAYLTRTLNAKAGIVISASHNPYQDNGVKFFDSDGCKLPDQVELAIESHLSETMSCVSPDKLGKATRIADADSQYIEFCKQTVPSHFSLKGLKIVIDCANGATYHVAPDVFSELGADLVVIGAQPDGLNINRECGATHPEALQQAVLAEHADLGIAFDGDGDRVIMVDHKGLVVDGDELLFVIAKNLLAHHQLQGGVVGTLMSNLGLELAFRELGVDFIRAKVGDRYVLAELARKNWLLGGESSGHLIHLGLNTTGDGIISALQVLIAMVQAQQSLFELKQGMQKLPQTLINVPISGQINLEELPPVKQAIIEAEARLQANGRVLLRPSGTEPLVRVMVEGKNEKLIAEVAKALADTVKTHAS
ncbi:MAG: phosphoglucosamine mutase [Legionellaceae bacterium]|nr:phosphoglucosamine mutase [Legionellaceae bacterium]